MPSLPDDLARAVDEVARMDGSFLLRSGQVASHYFDEYRFESSPLLLRRVATRMLALLPPGTEILAGLELGGVPLATAMSLESSLPVAFIRKAPKDHGTRRAIEGLDVNGRRVVIVEDVITTGGAVVDAARLLREAGAHLEAVVCAIWRGSGAPEIQHLPDVPIRAALTEADLSRR